MVLKALLLAAGLFCMSTAVRAQTLQDDRPLPEETKLSAEQFVAQRVKNAEDKNYISLSYENDLIGGGTDQYYTSGLRATYFNVNTPIPAGIDEMADSIPSFDINDTTSTYFSIGQNIFTPDDITIRTNQNNDRPWAAWLYTSVGLASFDEDHMDELEFTLGVVGPEALGEQVQKAVHKHITNSDLPKGWDNQLQFEPGVIFYWQRRWPQAFVKNIGPYRLRAEPNINLSLGNVYTYAGTGLNFRFGPNLGTLEDAPPRVRPAMPGTGFFETPKRGWNWYVFAGVDGRAIARNIFLDGNTFRDSPSIDKKYFVGDANAGVAFTYDQYRISYSFNARSKEFEGQDDMSTFGSITLSTRF
ncbi:MAG: lipid A deacylase LpxR family protein [Alphaproteobacteria bacterium]|nr:lipid A deacylase LpxR family protein [Alphaproteobacteria bacterium]